MIVDLPELAGGEAEECWKQGKFACAYGELAPTWKELEPFAHTTQLLTYGVFCPELPCSGMSHRHHSTLQAMSGHPRSL